MEVDEVPRSSGRFNLDRAAQEHMNEGLEVWIPPEPFPSVHSLDTQSIRPLMEVKLPGYTPSSTTSSSQAGSSSSRLKELQDRLQSKARDDSLGEGRPPTWRDHPVRSVKIASYKKNKDGAYHRMDWILHSVQDTEGCGSPHYRGQLDTGAVADPVTLAGWILDFFWSCEAADVGVPGDVGYGEDVYGHSDDGTIDVSRGESRKVMRLHEKMSCIL